MSLPQPPLQQPLFGVGTFLADCFEPNDRFRLAARQTLAEAYCADNGRPAEEPVLLLGACVLQFMERVQPLIPRQSNGFQCRLNPDSRLAKFSMWCDEFDVSTNPGLSTNGGGRPMGGRIS